MADINPRTYLYGMIMMMFIIVSGIGLLSEFKSSDATFDSADQTGEFNRTFNKFSDLQTEVSGLKSNIEDADTDFGAFGVLNALISSAWQSLKLLFGSFSFMSSVFNGLEAVFGVPAYIPVFIGLLITVTIIFSIYKMIFQTE